LKSFNGVCGSYHSSRRGCHLRFADLFHLVVYNRTITNGMLKKFGMVSSFQ
jgi:hypothetical protein